MLQRLFPPLLFLVLSACAGHNHQDSQTVLETPQNPAVMASEDCARITGNVAYPTAEQNLNPASIKLLNWNAQKHMHSAMHEDLVQLSADTDLILLQETAPDYDHLATIEPPLHWVYAPGYNWAGRTTGVITASRVKPLSYCRIMTREPWLRSPKAVNVTRYGLQDTSETLLVINVHLVNFSIGVSTLQRQLDAIDHLLSEHTGPVIVTGDFNTWSKKRARLVNETMAASDLRSVEYHTDKRTLFFGRPVDHLYIRGVNSASATTIEVESSDHNPITVRLSLL